MATTKLAKKSKTAAAIEEEKLFPDREKGKKLTRREKIAIKVLQQLEYSSRKIEKKTGISRWTIRQYKNKDLNLNDQKEVDQIVEQIKKQEAADLCLLHAKARINMHAMLDAGEVLPIELIALMDRTFQQRRLIEGQSTSNIAVLGQVLKGIDARGVEEIKEEAMELAKTQG